MCARTHTHIHSYLTLFMTVYVYSLYCKNTEVILFDHICNTSNYQLTSKYFEVPSDPSSKGVFIITTNIILNYLDKFLKNPFLLQNRISYYFTFTRPSHNTFYTSSFQTFSHLLFSLGVLTIKRVLALVKGFPAAFYSKILLFLSWQSHQ